MKKAMKKKVSLFVILALCLFLLSGCSFSDLMSWGAGVRQDPDYQTWEKLSEKGKLDAEGKYTANAVHVTFATNNYLEMHYYSDPERKQELSQTGCYLLPGDYIYASATQTHMMENFYIFDHLEVVEYDKDNIRKGPLRWQVAPEDKTTIMIPYDYKGTEVSVEPRGQFGARQINLKETAEDGSRVNGTWKLNNQEISERKIAANPLESYYAEYKYDTTRYYLISSSPAYWRFAPEDGIVVFNISGAKTGVENYEVFLGAYSYADISLKNGEIYSVLYDDNNNLASKEDGKHWTVSKVRQGTKLKLTASSRKKSDIAINSSIDYEISDAAEVQGYNPKRYLFTVEFGSSDQFLFVPSEYTAEHGKLRFSSNGKELTEKALLNSGMEIVCEAIETEDGYWLPNDGIHVPVKGSDTAEELRKIRFYPYRTVSVLLNQPKAGGKIIYRANNTELPAEAAELYCGTRIEADFREDTGWESEIGNHAEYIVTEANNQIASFNGRLPNEIFRENEGHKPRLNVDINQNVGECKTTLRSDGYNRNSEQATEGNIFRGGFKPFVSNQIIGTGQDIELSFSNMDFADDNNALKITVTKGSKTGEFKEIHYVNKANTPIQIRLDKEITYKSVTIRIEAVKAEPLKFHILENADLSVQYTDVKQENTPENPSLTAGTLISAGRQLAVTIQPHDGYFMSGPDTRNDVYRKNMNYEEYRNLNPQNLQNQVRKICTVHLDPKDAYGDVTFTIGGKVCSGETMIREDQEILIQYKLKDENYEIAADRDLLTQAISIVDSNVTRSIEVRKKVTRDMDGTSLSRSDVIEIRKKVGQ